jgi:hypothetical protein
MLVATLFLAAANGCDDSAGVRECAAAGGRCVSGSYLDCVSKGPQECATEPVPSGAFCCLKDIASSCGDAGVLNIKASNYDQSCTTASDCVAIGEGNACLQCTVACPTAAISKSAQASYAADIAKVPGRNDGSEVFCGCPAAFSPCCVAGQCHADSQCSMPTH